ncbi:helix-turn-helix domain-containing protein (plasmid) [Bacillus mycoides]|nr:helix-turn-helix domain-containing protein [Bacillus mycoides]
MLIQRQKELLSVLIQDKKWRTLTEIASQLNCSAKTIQRDLLILKSLLPSQWNLKICKGKGVVLNKPANSSNTEMDWLFIRNEISFQILNTLFYEKANTVVNLAESLYVTPSSLSVHVKKVEQYLKQFCLSLKRKPLMIHGEQMYIIFMYQEFYINSYGDHEWPFCPNEEIRFHQYVTTIEQKLQITLCPSSKRRLMYLIAVMVKQKQQGNILALDPCFSTKIIDTPFYLEIFQLCEGDNPYFFQMEEMVLIVISINCSTYIHQDLIAYKQEVLHHFQRGDIEIYRDIKKLVLMLEDTFERKLIYNHNHEFIFAIIQSLKQLLSKCRFLPHINNTLEEGIYKIKMQHTETFYKIQEVYQKWIKQFNFKQYILDEAVAALTLHIEGTLMLSCPLYVRVLLLIEDGEKWALYIQGILYQQFGPIFQFAHANIQDIKNYDYAQLSIDLIITTFTSVRSQVPIVRISTIPTNRELHDIREFVYRDFA